MATNLKKKLKKKFVRGELAVIDWIDACSSDEWEKADDIVIDPEHITTCGIIFEHTEEKIVVALNHDPANDSFSCLIVIPIGMVTDANRLKKV